MIYYILAFLLGVFLCVIYNITQNSLKKDIEEDKKHHQEKKYNNLKVSYRTTAEQYNNLINHMNLVSYLQDNEPNPHTDALIQRSLGQHTSALYLTTYSEAIAKSKDKSYLTSHEPVIKLLNEKIKELSSSCYKPNPYYYD